MRKKAERRWTVMLVPHGSGASRAVEVSQTFVKALVGIGSVVALTFLVLGIAAISRGVSITRSRALENENRLLADEIQRMRSEEHTSELQSRLHLVCRLLLEKKKKRSEIINIFHTTAASGLSLANLHQPT